MTLSDLINLFTPNEAGAEMIPETPGAKVATDKILAQPGPMGDIARSVHSRPEKVYVTDQPDTYMNMVGTPGLFNPRFASKDYQIQLNPEVIAWMQKQKGSGRDMTTEVLAHELGHTGAQIAGVGGSRQPSGYGLVDMFAGQRLPKSVNETLADVLAGFQTAQPNSELEKMTKKVKEKLRGR